MRLACFLPLAIIACAKREAPAPQADAAPAQVATVSGAPVEPAPLSFTSSLAKFSGDFLQLCVDMTITGAPDLDASALKGNPAEAATKSMRAKDKSLTGIPKTCGEQFPDRTSLASCVLRAEEPRGSMRLVSQHYAFEDVGLTDAAMKECLSEKGDWSAIPRDSHAWRAAKLEHDQRRLRKITDKLADP
jgi:hypothetical protein